MPPSGVTADALKGPPIAPSSADTIGGRFEDLGAGTWVVSAIDASADSRWASGQLDTFEVRADAQSQVVLDAPKLRRVTLRIANWDDLELYLRPTAVWIRDSVWKLADGSVSVLFEEPWPGTLRFTARGEPSADLAVPLDPDAREVIIELPKDVMRRWR
jgi:hypothetical protein